MWRTAEGKQRRQIDNRPSVRMPLQTMTNNNNGNGDSDSGNNDDDDGGSNGVGGKEDKGGDTQTTIN
jgi:hypothetical protein